MMQLIQRMCDVKNIRCMQLKTIEGKTIDMCFITFTIMPDETRAAKVQNTL